MARHSKSIILRTPITVKHAIDVISALPYDNENPQFVVTVSKYIASRTIKQSNLFHEWIDIIAKETGNTPESTKQELKARFLKPVFTEFKDPKTGQTSVKVSYPSTTELNKKEMSDFMDNVYHLAIDYGILLPVPDDLKELA